MSAAWCTFTGAVPRKEVYEYLSLLDVAVLPHSNDFGSPVVMFEFMGSASPWWRRACRRSWTCTPTARPRCSSTRWTERNARPRSSGCCRARPAPPSPNAPTQLLSEHTWDRNASRILESAGLGRTEATRMTAYARIGLVAELPPPPGGMAVQAERLTAGLRERVTSS